MKELGLLGKFAFGVNLLVALLLLISFVLPHFPPTKYPNVSLLSLAVSPLILLNVIFVVYWIIRLQMQFALSLTMLVAAWFYFNPFVEFSSEGNFGDYGNKLKILSYNVRLFNAYEKEPSVDFLSSFSKLLEDKDPDVLCIQEYYRNANLNFSAYKYKFVHFNGLKNKLGHAIFSKYPIITTGAFDFESSSNNALFADIVKGNDTIRVYNLHLQSLGITPTVDALQEDDKDRLRNRISTAFGRQQNQVEKIIAHKAQSPYKNLVCGDFNNTSFSYVYRKMQINMKDAFVERGGGLGTTFLFDNYPMRIDFILTSSKLEVLKFETGKNSFSDHYPISATIGW